MKLQYKAHLTLIIILLLLTHKAYTMDEHTKKQCLIKAYPSYITQNGEEVVTKRGKTLIWNDGKSKTFDEMLNYPDLKGKIFNMFTDARMAGTAGEQSFGLGLAISRQIVEAHGGKIWFENNEEIGTTFYLELPDRIM